MTLKCNINEILIFLNLISLYIFFSYYILLQLLEVIMTNENTKKGKENVLNKLDINTYAEVTNVHCDGLERRRLFDLGIIPGTKIKPILKSPCGDLIAYEIRGSIIAIREEDSNKIKVKEI